MAAARPLTPLQARFVQEYLLDLNATAAYLRAGYKAKGGAATANASRLMANANVAEAIRAGQDARSKRVTLDADYVLGRLRENVERAMQAAPVLDKDGSPTGEYRYEGSVANKALELLGKHLGLFVDRQEITGKGGGPIQTKSELTVNVHDDLAPYLAVIAGLGRDLAGADLEALPGDGAPKPVHPPEADAPAGAAPAHPRP